VWTHTLVQPLATPFHGLKSDDAPAGAGAGCTSKADCSYFGLCATDKAQPDLLRRGPVGMKTDDAGRVNRAAPAAFHPMDLQAPPSAGDLVDPDTTVLSYEGSWSFLRLLPWTAPFSFGTLGYATYSDTVPGLPLFPNVLTLDLIPGIGAAQQEGTASAKPRGGCTTPDEYDIKYEWRPDFATTSGSCGGVGVSHRIGYHGNASICATYRITSTSPEPRAVSFSGAAPLAMTTKSGRPAMGGAPWNNSTATKVSQNSVLVTMNAQCQWDQYPVERIDRWWLLRADLPVKPMFDSNGRNYSWRTSVSASSPVEATFCLSELYSPPQARHSAEKPVFDISPTTAAIDAWLADIKMPQASSSVHARHDQKVFYTAWFQFWLNTEHESGNFVRPFICGSMSYYPRGQWLWDTGFHVFGLLSGGPLGLQKALDQLANFVAGGRKIGHTPRAIGAQVYQTETQPPGILTWAALTVYNRTRDMKFLKESYDSFNMNNEWYMRRRSPLPSNLTGLAIWGGEDTGWDTSPRWDCPAPALDCAGHGPVCPSEAVDVNAWLRIDALMLAEMAQILGLQADARRWSERALAVAQAMNKYLWNETDRVYWDRNESSGHIRIVTPVTFFALLSGVSSAEQASAMVNVSFRPDRLATPYSLPCLGVSEPTFQPNDYWRGPSWININWLSAIGLECYGFGEQASLILNSSRQLVLGGPYPFEYYNPFNGTGRGAEHFMWSGALYLIITKELQRGHPSDAAQILRHLLPCKIDDSHLDLVVGARVVFGAVQQIGVASNLTGIDGHWWMPFPLFRSSSSMASELLVSVAIQGDGAACPPPDHPHQPCAAGFHKAHSRSAPWTPNPAGTIAGNSIIRLNASVSRGFSALWLNQSTNTSGQMFFDDWTEPPSPSGRLLRKGDATITGMPPMLGLSYLQTTASAVLSDGTTLTQFYGYTADAPATGGCKPAHTWEKAYCYSILTLASKDKGLNWHYRSSIHWDGSAGMSAEVEGPCEPSLVVLPDGKTLLSVFRLQSDKNLWMAKSQTQGHSWETAQETNTWAVFPQVRALPNGALALTAGRPGIGLWITDGRGTIDPKGWRFYNLATAHNAAISDPELQFGAPELAIVNVSSQPSNPVMTKVSNRFALLRLGLYKHHCFLQAYTGLELQGCTDTQCQMIVSYDRLANGNAGPPGPHGKVDRSFTMQFVIKLKTEDETAAVAPRPQTMLPGLDHWAVSSRPGTAVFLNQPRRHSNTSILARDRPYEGGTVPNLGGGGGITYATVLRAANDSFMMWYSSMYDILTPSRANSTASQHNYSFTLCLALSADGLAWTKPDLHLFEEDGSTSQW
jgi:hypothetical protein